MKDLDQIRQKRDTLGKQCEQLRQRVQEMIKMFHVDVHQSLPTPEEGHIAGGIADMMNLHDTQLWYQIRMLQSLKEQEDALEREMKELTRQVEAVQAETDVRTGAALEYTKESLLLSMQQISQQQLLLENEIRLRENLRTDFGQAREAARILQGTEHTLWDEQLRRTFHENTDTD